MDSGLQPPIPDSEDLQRYSELQLIDLETLATYRHETTLYLEKNTYEFVLGGGYLYLSMSTSRLSILE
jgi:hypothetical protein